MTLNPLSTIRLATLIWRRNNEQTRRIPPPRSSIKNMKQAHQDLEGPKLLLLKSQTLKEEHNGLLFFSRNWIKNNIFIFNIFFFLHVYIVLFCLRFFSSVRTNKRKCVKSVHAPRLLDQTVVYAHSEFQNPLLHESQLLVRGHRSEICTHTHRLVKSIMLS